MAAPVSQPAATIVTRQDIPTLTPSRLVASPAQQWQEIDRDIASAPEHWYQGSCFYVKSLSMHLQANHTGNFIFVHYPTSTNCYVKTSM